MDSPCPDDEEIGRFVEGVASPDELVAMEQHLANCEACLDLMAAVVDAEGDDTDAAKSVTANGDGETLSPSTATALARVSATGASLGPTLAPGTLLGRYEVRRWLGRGGMGDVYEGFDRHLERRVALKILRDGGGDHEVARQRLGREAKALARLSHPNVVAVHDVGLEGDHLFLVMELVEGPTLAAWLKTAPRTWRQILDVFVGAGEGLAAAHDVDVIHRDFKPQNVLIGADGKARVSDFGLARSGGADSCGAALSYGNGVPSDDRPESLTGNGAVIGTPRYMAPEQTLGHRLDARADQFSFAVALYEALFGNHPFAQDLPEGPARKFHFSRNARLRSGRSVRDTRATGPASLAAILARGLAVDANHRFGSLHDLLSSLRRARRTTRRRTILAVGGAVALAMTAVVGWSTSRGKTTEIITPTGEPADWSHLRVIAQLGGVVHCFQAVGDHTLRVVSGNLRHAEDINVVDGRRRPADIVPESYRYGCPSLSPDRTQLLYEGFDVDQRPHIFHATNPRGENAKAVVSCAHPSLQSEPQWLSSNRDFVFDLDITHPAVFSLAENRVTIIPDRDRVGDAGAFRVVAPTGDRIAVLQHRRDPLNATTITVFHWPALRPETTAVTVSLDVAPTLMSFGSDPNVIHGRAFRADEPERQLVAIDMRQRTASLVGKVPGRDIVRIVRVDGTTSALVIRRNIGSVVTKDKSGSTKVLFSEIGSMYESPSRTRLGELVALRSRGRRSNVVRLNSIDGTSQDLTPGPDDIDVSALPDGGWLVARNRPIGIFRCREDGGHACSKLTDQTSARMAVSPDGRMLAYWVLDDQRLSLWVLPLDGGTARELANLVTQCRPVWSSPTTVWYSQPDGAGFTWKEVDVNSGRPTGRSRPGESNCYDLWDDPASPDESGLRAVVSDEFDIRLVSLREDRLP